MKWVVAIALIAICVLSVSILAQTPNEPYPPGSVSWYPRAGVFTRDQIVELRRLVSEVRRDQYKRDLLAWEAIRPLQEVYTGTRIFVPSGEYDTVIIKDEVGNIVHYPSDSDYVVFVTGHAGDLFADFTTNAGTSTRYLADSSFIVRKTSPIAVNIKYAWVTMPRGRKDYFAP